MKFLPLLVLSVIAASGEDSKLFKDFMLGNNLFAADVYRELLKSHSGNFLVCPLSAEIILALVHNGAGGKTAEELASGLHFPNDKKNIQERIRLLAPHLEGSDKYALNSANKIYVKDGYEIKDEFKNTAVNIYNSDIQNIDFKNNVEAAQTINRWVEEQTREKLKNLINKDDLDENTRMVLINAMYFYGKWVHQFPLHATQPQTFYTADGKENQVQMMQQLNHFNYFDCQETQAQFLELKYEGSDVTMTFVLPKDKDGLPALEARIADVLGSRDYEKHLVELKIPKFEFQFTIEFKPILETLGILEAFRDSADFGGILVDEALMITKVIQKTFIEVTEEGTTASASTTVGTATPTAGLYVPPPLRRFIADHPFIYYIKIKGFVFFVGRYTGV